MNTSISIIIPVYNPNITLLRKALDSVLFQTLKDIEIIIVDDCSTIDYYNEILFYLRNPSFKLFKLASNNGAGFARNVGIRNATGKYIAFLDSDDEYYSNDVLEKLFFIAENKKMTVVGAKAISNYNGVDLQIIWSFKNYTQLFTNRVADISDFQICYGFWSFIYKRDFINQYSLLFNNLSRYQDPIWFYNVLCKANKFYCADLPYYFHRTKDVVSFNWNKKTLSDYFRGIAMLSTKSLGNKHYDLHVFLYRKMLFWEYKMFLRAQNELKINVFDEFSCFLSSFDSDIIKQYEPELPILKTIDDFLTINIDDYKKFDY